MEELSKKVPVLCDFHASWTYQCYDLRNVLRQLAKDFQGKFILAIVDLDNGLLTTKIQKYEVTCIPNVILFKNGKKVSSF